MHGARTVGKHSEVFVAFDVAKKKHAVAIAEGGRTEEVRFLGDVQEVRCRSSGRSGDWLSDTTGCTSALKRADGIRALSAKVTATHRRWLAGQTFEHAAQQIGAGETKTRKAVANPRIRV
jgi:hypothetical protein